MSARSWWGGWAKPAEDQNEDEKAGKGDPPSDALLDARFDKSGTLASTDERGRKRVLGSAEPADTDVDELDIAVRKLSEGLEALERESRGAQRPAASAAPAKAAAADVGGSHEFVTYSLDRLESRLEALSRRLQQRTQAAPPAVPPKLPPMPAADEGEAEERAAIGADLLSDPPLTMVPLSEIEAQLAEARSLAEAEERRAAEAGAEEEEHLEAAERAHREAEEAAENLRQAEAAETRRQSEISEARRLAEATEARRKAEVAEARRAAEAAELKRQADLAEARRQAEMAEARRKAEAAAASEERRRQHEEAEAARQADLADARRREEAVAAKIEEVEEKRRVAEIAAARRQTEQAAAIERQFAIIEGRIDALQNGLDENQVEPVRGELLELVQEMADLSRSGRSAAESLDQISARLDEMEVKLHASRNLASNRLGDIQDRIGGLVERLDEIEVEIPGFDAIRENQSAIFERFDRMEGLVEHLSSPTELFDRMEGMRRQLQAMASEQGVMRLEAQILKLADRVDALPADLSGTDALQRLESQLGAFATEFVEARRQRKAVATEFDDRLSDLSSQIRDVGESARTPDLSGIEEQLSALSNRLNADRERTGETFSRFEERLGKLGEAIERQEEQATAEILDGLTQKIDAISEAIDAQDSSGTRRDIEVLDGKLGHLSEQLATQSEQLSQDQMQPIRARLDEVQEQLEELGRRAQDANSLFRPFLQKLQEISDRMSVLGAEGAPTPISERFDTLEERLTGLSGKGGPDPRALQTQLDGVISRLETLKGRSIDPARLHDLFDRVDSAIRALPEERFDRIERRLAEAAFPTERFDRLEKKFAETSAGLSAERLARLESRLDEIGGIFGAGGDLLTQEDLTDLRSDIVALRRELRSMPGAGQEGASLTEMVRALAKRVDRLAAEPPITAADLEAQMDRIAAVLEDPSHGRMALAHIETSLKTIERRLEDTRRALGQEEEGEVSVHADESESIARALSDDVTALKSSSQQTERKTRDAIDAVQDTLEAVVKRMAFLERDADKASAAEREVGEVAEEPEPQDQRRTVMPEPDDQPPSGLLSRLTSRQLLKRATGGRAESFSPEPEEGDEGSDFPLEPGTDAPLSSALADAPSSDTEFMSGARKGRLTHAYPDADRDSAGGHTPLVDDDFLAAARRAARAATSETSGPGQETGAVQGKGRGRRLFGPKGRRVLLGTVLGVVLVVAVVQIARTEFWHSGEAPLASLPATTAPAGEPQSAAAPQSTDSATTADSAMTTAPDTSAPSPDSSATDESAAATPPAASTSGDIRPEENETAATNNAAPPPPATSSETMPDTSSSASSSPDATTTAPDTSVASVAPTETPSAAPTSEEPAALPPAIGPDRLREAAMAGDAVAAFEEGARYAEGRGTTPDMTAAVAWYTRAGNSGLAPAQYRLGSIFEKGLGVPRNLTAALEWYSRAADVGNVKAMHNLAVLYAEGAGGPPDLEHAATLFRQAAEHGVRDSQFNLAILNARGLGVPQDLVEAYKWFAIAASSGDEEAAKRRDIIAQALSESDLAAAKAAAAAFQPAPLVAEANEVQMPDDGWGDDSSSSVGTKSQNDLVALVQKLLSENGYDPGPADGLLGQKTIDAITAFQGKAGLPRTGQIDDRTVAALQTPST